MQDLLYVSVLCNRGSCSTPELSVYPSQMFYLNPFTYIEVCYIIYTVSVWIFLRRLFSGWGLYVLSINMITKKKLEADGGHIL